MLAGALPKAGQTLLVRVAEEFFIPYTVARILPAYDTPPYRDRVLARLDGETLRAFAEDNPEFREALLSALQDT